jgi:hypothetical protein
MCESGIFVGGSLQFCQDTRKDLRFIRKSRDLIAKLQGLLLPSYPRAQELLAAPNRRPSGRWGARVTRARAEEKQEGSRECSPRTEMKEIDRIPKRGGAGGCARSDRSPW